MHYTVIGQIKDGFKANQTGVCFAPGGQADVLGQSGIVHTPKRTAFYSQHRAILPGTERAGKELKVKKGAGVPALLSYDTHYRQIAAINLE